MTATAPHRPYGGFADGPLGPGGGHPRVPENHPDSFEVVVVRRNPEAHVEFTVTREEFDADYATEGFTVTRVLGTYDFDGYTECFRFTPADGA